MPRVLLLECSPNDLASPGGQLAREMARRIHPKAEVIVRNLVREPLPPICAEYAGAVVGHADRADEHFALSEQLIGELERSHYLIISTPMHNYMVPAALKLWLDYVVRIRRTFEIHNGQRVGLLEDRPTFVVLSSGGHYLGAKAKQMDFLSPYLRHVLGIIGLHHVEYLHLQGLADGEEAVNAALRQARERLSFNPVFAPEPFPDVVL